MRCSSRDQPLIRRYDFAEMLLLAFWRGLCRLAQLPMRSSRAEAGCRHSAYFIFVREVEMNLLEAAGGPEHINGLREGNYGKKS